MILEVTPFSPCSLIPMFLIPGIYMEEENACLSASSITLSCAASQLIKVERVFVARTAVAGKLLCRS